MTKKSVPEGMQTSSLVIEVENLMSVPRGCCAKFLPRRRRVTVSIHTLIFIVCIVFILMCTGLVDGQTTTHDVETVLEPTIEPTSAVAFELEQYLMKRIPKLSTSHNAQQWRAEARRLREHLLQDIAFHGWPRKWVDAEPNFEELRVIETGNGYRLRKLRYQIVPGFSSTAILYEPEKSSGRLPAILSVNGHEKAGNAVEYKQKLNINLAKRGILTLSLEWPGFGELALPENRHDYGAHLDLVGANALGFS